MDLTGKVGSDLLGTPEVLDYDRFNDKTRPDKLDTMATLPKPDDNVYVDDLHKSTDSPKANFPELCGTAGGHDLAWEVETIETTSVTLLHAFDAKLKGESNSPLLYDVSLTRSGHHVIVTDCLNRCVKAFDLRRAGRPCVSVVQLREECPLCMTHLSGPDRLVVTLHQRRQLYVLNVLETDDVSEPEKTTGSEVGALGSAGEEGRAKWGEEEKPGQLLSFRCTISTSSQYRGISTLRGDSSSSSNSQRLVVTAPQEIHVLALDGQVLQVVAPTLCGLPLLRDAIYVSSTPTQDMVVTDVGARRLLCLSPSGQLRWFFPSLQVTRLDAHNDHHHEDDGNDDDDGNDEEGGYCGEGGCSSTIRWPLGVTSDQQGRVAVCDLQLHSVILLSPNGAASRLLLSRSQDLQYPRGLCAEGGLLCVTQDDSVKVFSMHPHPGP